jgi:hypothetical protein
VEGIASHLDAGKLWEVHPLLRDHIDTCLGTLPWQERVKTVALQVGSPKLKGEVQSLIVMPYMTEAQN